MMDLVKRVSILFLLLFIAVSISLHADSDSLWIESMVMEPGKSYKLNVYANITQTISSFSIPLVSTSSALEFDTATLEGSIAPLNTQIGSQVKDNGERMVVYIFPAPSSFENFLPPGGKLCELYVSVNPEAIEQTVLIDTLTDVVVISPEISIVTPLTAYGENGIVEIPLKFSPSENDIRIYIDADDYDGDVLPADFNLFQNSPNPFNPSTKIMFEIPSADYVRLEVYNVLGQSVAVLVDEHLEAGVHSVEFGISDLSAGIYFYRLTAKDFHATRKMMYLK